MQPWAELHEVEDEGDRLSDERERTKLVEMDEAEIEELLDDLLDIANADEIPVLREFLALVIERITVYEDHLKLRYSIPVRGSKGPPGGSAGRRGDPMYLVMKVAEGEGFEPPVPVGHNGFQDRHLKPLGHPSAPGIIQRPCHRGNAGFCPRPVVYE